MSSQANIISAALAEADSETQAQVLNEFVAHLTVLCKQHLNGSVGTQGYYICKDLREPTVEFFKELVSSWEYQRDHRRAEVAELDSQLTFLRKERDRLKAEIAVLEQ